MIYFFYGDNQEAKRKRVGEILKSLKNTEIVEISDLEFNLDQLENLIRSDSLFGQKQAIVFSNILESGEIQNIISDRLDILASSNNTFIFLDKKILKDLLSKIEKRAEEVKEFKALKPKFEKTNPFIVTNPLGRRDKKSTWINLQKVLSENIEPEALAGIIFWKIKTMILENDTKKFSEKELKDLSSKLISVYHDSHRGLFDLEIALEKLILESL